MQLIDKLSVSTIRVLAADIVQKSKSGHPGAPMVSFSSFFNSQTNAGMVNIFYDE